jgi:hypothetical protein
MKQIEESRRTNRVIRERPEGFDPNKYVSFKAYEKVGAPMTY